MKTVLSPSAMVQHAVWPSHLTAPIWAELQAEISAQIALHCAGWLREAVERSVVLLARLAAHGVEPCEAVQVWAMFLPPLVPSTDLAARLVREWTDLRRDDLLANWERTQELNPLVPVEPLQ